MPRTPHIPSVTETDEALAKIGEHRDQEAAQALRALAEAILRVVCEQDQLSGVSRYLQSLTVTYQGSGVFELQLQDQNAAVDTKALAQEVCEAVQGGTIREYGKLQRPVQLDRETR